MPMKHPPHPGLSLREAYLDPLGLSVTQAAAMLGVTRAALSRILNGKAGISADMALRLAQAFGGSAETWLKLQMAYDLVQARRHAPKRKVQRVGALPSAPC